MENGNVEYHFPEDGDEVYEEWMYLARWVATKSKKNKVTVDCDYIDNMRLNFNNEEMINFLPFWLESQKAEDGRSALSDGTDYQNIVLQLNQLTTL